MLGETHLQGVVGCSPFGLLFSKSLPQVLFAEDLVRHCRRELPAGHCARMKEVPSKCLLSILRRRPVSKQHHQLYGTALATA